MLESTIMTMTIELAPEIEKLLQIEAERKGLSPHKIVQIVLEEKFSRQKHSKQDLWQKLFAEGLITHSFAKLMVLSKPSNAGLSVRPLICHEPQVTR